MAFRGSERFFQYFIGGKHCVASMRHSTIPFDFRPSISAAGVLNFEFMALDCL
jgi:hypothetical protein